VTKKVAIRTPPPSPEDSRRSVVQHPDLKACPFPFTSKRLSARTTSPALRVKKAAAPEASEPMPSRKAAPPRSGSGFLLMGSSLNLISFNAEAVQILGYPDNIESLAGSDALLSEKIQSRLINQSSPGESGFVMELRSGRRHYFCRSFLIDSPTKEASQACTAVLLERGPCGLISLSRVFQQSNLTPREQEALQYLLQGASTKEIANRMNVSPNTAKAFVRLIMVKTQVSSRSAVLAKIMITS
jgi:DNA-binding CsgD family transcriptional regulator